MRSSIDKSLKIPAGQTFFWPNYDARKNIDGQDIMAMTKHSIHSTDEGITVQYKIGGEDAPLQTLAVNPDAPNGWADGSIWNQAGVYQFQITVTVDTTVRLSSYTDKNV